MQQNPNIRFQVAQVNEFLKEIYSESRLISDILRDGGVDDDSLGKLKQERLEPFYARLLYHWYEWIAVETTSRGAYILFRQRGLDGQSCSGMADIGGQLRVSPEGIRQIEAKTLRRIRSSRSTRILEKLAVMAAQEVLGNDQLQMPKLAELALAECEASAIEATVPGGAIDNAEAAILAVVHEMPAKLTRIGVAKHLVGSLSRRSEVLRTHHMYGMCRMYRRSSIVAIVDRMIESGKLRLSGSRLVPPAAGSQQGTSGLK